MDKLTKDNARMKVIWHFYANQVNMGDWASALGIRQFVSASTPKKIQYLDRFLLDPITDEDIDAINQTADLVLVGGGGLWRRRDDLPSGWLWNITPNQLRAIRRPIVVYAVGLNEEYKRPATWSIERNGVEGIRQIVDQAALVGVRDYWTLDWLDQQRTQMDNIFLVPCPSMLLGEAPQPDAVQRDVIGINLVPSSRMAKADAFFGEIQKILGWLRAEGFAIKYLCNSSTAEDSVIRLAEAYPGDVVIPHSPSDLLAAYGSVRMVVGMRAHAILLAFNRNVPVFSIGYNRKCEAFLQLLKAEEYLVKWNPSTWSLKPDLYRKAVPKIVSLIERTSEIQHVWQDLRASYRAYNQTFATRITQLL